MRKESHPMTDSKRGGGGWRGRICLEKGVSFFLCTCLGVPGDVAVPVVASVAGVLCLVIVPIIIWKLLNRQLNNERQRLLNQDKGNHGIDESENHFSGGSEASELTLGRGSARSTNPSSAAGSSCSDITETQKNSFNSKINRNMEGRC